MDLDLEGIESLLRYAVTEKGYQLSKIAKDIRIAPVTVRRWKRGQQIPERENVKKLEDRFIGEVHICLWCGEAFEPNDKDDIFCSHNCKDKYLSFRSERNLARDNNEYPKVICKYCGKEFQGKPQSKYCSEKCRQFANTNPDYYSVFYRDHFRCRYCGRTPADNIKLTIDHVYPKSKGGKEEKINLVTACAECNSRKSATLWDKERIKEIWWQNKKLAKEQKIGNYDKIKKEFKEEYPNKKMPILRGGLKNHKQSNSPPG